MWLGDSLLIDVGGDITVRDDDVGLLLVIRCYNE